MNKPRDKKGKFIKIPNPKKFRMRLTLDEKESIEEKRTKKGFEKNESKRI